MGTSWASEVAMHDPNVSLIIPLYSHNDTTGMFCSQEITMFDGQTVFLGVKSTCLMVKAFSLVISGYWSWISQYLMVQTCQDPLFRDWMLLPVGAPKFESIWTLNQPTNLSWLADRPWFPISSPAPQPSWAPAVVVGPPPRRLFGAARHRAPCRWEAAPRASCSKEVLGWNMRIVEVDLWVVIFRLNMSFHH